MKKLLSILCIVTVILGLAACNKSGPATGFTEDTVARQEAQLPLSGLKLLVDAGHGKFSEKGKKEPIAPGSSEMKAANVTGTQGENQSEAELNLKVSKVLESKLQALGATVYMTRNDENSTMSNVERAEYGNQLQADLVIRVHANGADDKTVSGILTMIPGDKHIKDANVVANSKRAGELVQKHMLAKTGAKDGGVVKYDTLTGFNWTRVPTILVEMGFMTNPQEDKLLETSEYQEKIVDGIIGGVLEYF